MLYICATPIGNKNDISIRALDILGSADVILCEDTRLTRQLLNIHNISPSNLISLREQNENEITCRVLHFLSQNLTVVQVSDAGTPGISDPGSRLCTEVLNHNYKISPIPGPCAYTSLLSVSGINIPSLFYGFLPSTINERKKILNKYQDVDYALCVYEAPHRIIASLKDMIEIFGEDRIIVMGRELTKKFETIKKLKTIDLFNFIVNNLNEQRGEFTLLIEPKIKFRAIADLTQNQKYAIEILSQELPPKKAVAITHQILGGDKNLLYRHLVDRKESTQR